MIVANNNQWVIATPAKTGSYSLENTLIKRLGVAHKLEANNRVGVTYDGKIKRRILVVRHPLDRWASMYWFAKQKAKDGRSIWLASESSHPQRYAEAWLTGREAGAHPNFVLTFCEMAEQFGATEVAKTENLKEFVKRLGYAIVVSHSNRTRSRARWPDTLAMLQPLTKQAILRIYKDDLKRFNYEV